MKTQLIGLLTIVAASSAGAMEIQQGEIACRSGKALSTINQARVDGDQKTIDWLIHSSACFEVDANVTVELLDQSMGWQQVRTTERRKNVNLWISSNSLIADNSL